MNQQFECKIYIGCKTDIQLRLGYSEWMQLLKLELHSHSQAPPDPGFFAPFPYPFRLHMISESFPTGIQIDCKSPLFSLFHE